MGNSLFEVPGSAAFFISLEYKYPEQASLLDYGYLTGRWLNVRQHCRVQTAAMEDLGVLLGFPLNIIERMARVAIMHDTRKRIDIMYDRRLRNGEPPDFSKAEVERFDQVFKEVNPDPDLMSALNPWFLPKVLLGKASFLQLVQFLVDDMAKGEEIVPFDERIDEVSQRNPHPEPEVEKLLGRPYWEVEREIGHRVITMVAMILKARYVSFDESNPGKALADLINCGIMERIGKVQ